MRLKKGIQSIVFNSYFNDENETKNCNVIYKQKGMGWNVFSTLSMKDHL